MPTSFVIHPTEHLVEEYRSLLLEDWDPPILVRALQLAHETLLVAGLRVVFRWSRAPEVQRSLPQRYIVPPSASDDVAAYISSLNKQKAKAEPMRRRTPVDITREEIRLAEETSFHLTAPTEGTFRRSEVVIKDPAGFYRDVRSIIFRLAVEHLLPVLMQQQASAVNLLAGSLSEFARFEWDDQPQHRDTLLAELYEELGRKDDAIVLRESALRATGFDAHEYLTKVQALIHAYLDVGDVDSAERELFKVIRATRGEQDEELQSILRDILAARSMSFVASA